MSHGAAPPALLRQGPPATTYPSLPGRRAGDTAWPSPSVTPIAYALRGAPVLVRSPQRTGVDAGRFRPVASADVAADGSSTLVTRGALNLSAR